MTEIKDAAYYEKIEKYIKTCTPLWELKPGDTFTQTHYDSLLELIGKSPATSVGAIYFKDGKPIMKTGEAIHWEVKETEGKALEQE